MRILFLLFTIFLVFYQAAPGNAQAAADTLACGQVRGAGCVRGPCMGASENIGTCQGGTLNCCKWPRQP